MFVRGYIGYNKTDCRGVGFVRYGGGGDRLKMLTSRVGEQMTKDEGASMLDRITSE